MSEQMRVQVRRLDAGSAGFEREFAALLAWESVSDPVVQQTVSEILQAVRTRGDAALLEYTQRLDRSPATAIAALELPQPRLQAALAAIPAVQREALEQ